MAPDLDVITIGACFVELASPEPGVSVGEARSLLKYTSGAGTIAALGMRRLGATVGIISKVGDDELGQGLLDHLGSVGIDTSHIGRVAGQLHATAFAPPPCVDLCLDHDFSAESACDLAGLAGVVSHVSLGNRDVILPQNPLSLVLVNFH